MPGTPQRFVETSHALCKSLTKHHWTLRRGHGWLQPDSKGYIPLVYDCQQCETEKHQGMHMRTGVITSPVYKWPDGYLFKYEKDEERLTGAEVRVLALTHLRANYFAGRKRRTA